MESESLFLKQIKPEVVVKEEPFSSILALESRLDKLAPVHMHLNNSPAIPPLDYKKCDRESSVASTSADPLNGTEQTKIRLANKDLEIEAAKNWLRNFPDWLRPQESNIPEVGDWIDYIEAILKHAELPRVVLGFMGPSGCGKSSVINALLEEESLLPCNCSEACTGVAVEVAWNQIDEPEKAYRAKISFITASEWKAELDLLVAELITLEPGAKPSQNGNEAKVAAAKLKTVYPDLDIGELTEESASELMKDSKVSKWLGKDVEIEMPASKGNLFAAEISQYIDSSPRPAELGEKQEKATPYWPLVKVVQIFARSQVLSTGLVLVDLPGSGDSNLARQMVAQDYMNQVAAICIVADIKRAVTEEVARNLFGRGKALKRRLLRDGLLDDEHTFFVLTCTDIINNQQVIRAQALNKLPEVSQILEEQEIKNKRLQNIILERKNLQRKKCVTASNVPKKRQRVSKDAGGQQNLQALKRKRNGDKAVPQDKKTTPSMRDHDSGPRHKGSFHENHRKAISELNTEENRINYELSALKNRLSTICIEQRNSYVTLRMKADFSCGLQDLEKELRDDGDDEADRIPLLGDSIRDGVDTFCVCSKAYQKFCGRFPLEEMPTGFDDAEDTSLPQLLAHCMEYTLNARERLADAFLDHLARLRRRMRGWSDNSTPDKQITSRQSRLLKKSFTDHLESFEKIMSDTIGSAAEKLRVELQSLSSRALKSAVPTAAKASLEILGGWKSDIQNVRTWKAICRKDGTHHSRSDGRIMEHNWNDDLAEEFFKLLDNHLRKIAIQVLPELQQDYRMNLQKGFEKFNLELQSTCLTVTRYISSTLQNFMHNQERLQVESTGVADSRFTGAMASSRVIDRKVPTTVRLAMKPGYTIAAGIRGPGSFNRSKAAIEDHITENSKDMYASAASEISRCLEDIVTILKSNLAQDCKKSFEKIKADFEKMLAVANETPRPESSAAKVQLQKEVLEKLSHFDSLLGEFRERKHLVDIEDLEEEEEEEDSDDDEENDYDEDDVSMAEYENEMDEGKPELRL